MNKLDVLSMAIKNLLKRKMRTFLTVLGVVIGATSIIIMISLGLGINRSFEEQLGDMGDITKIDIYADSHGGGGEGSRDFDDAFIEELKQVPGVTAVSPLLEAYTTIEAGKHTVQTSLIGVDPDMMKALKVPMLEGEVFTEADKSAIVFGSEVPYEFKTKRERQAEERAMMSGSGGMYYDGGMDEEEREPANVDVMTTRMQISFKPEDDNQSDLDGDTGDTDGQDGVSGLQNQPTSSGRSIRPIKVRGVGVMDGTIAYENAYQSYIHIDTATEILKNQEKMEKAAGVSPRDMDQNQNKKGYERGIVKCESIDTVEEVVEYIKAAGFQDVYSPTQYIQEMQQMVGSLQMFLGFIGGVALVVSAIGIANTMVMSIYERTKEIGIMKVIGASIADVRNLFLTEAALIGLFGGIFGVALSFVISYIINHVDLSFIEMFAMGAGGGGMSYIPPWLALGGLGFSAIIGFVSGVWPAFRAMRLSPIEAIHAD